MRWWHSPCYTVRNFRTQRPSTPGQLLRRAYAFLKTDRLSCELVCGHSKALWRWPSQAQSQQQQTTQWEGDLEGMTMTTAFKSGSCATHVSPPSVHCRLPRCHGSKTVRVRRAISRLHDPVNNTSVDSSNQVILSLGAYAVAGTCEMVLSACMCEYHLTPNGVTVNALV
jgi:hypothetical protein